QRELKEKADSLEKQRADLEAHSKEWKQETEAVKSAREGLGRHRAELDRREANLHAEATKSGVTAASLKSREDALLHREVQATAIAVGQKGRAKELEGLAAKVRQGQATLEKVDEELQERRKALDLADKQTKASAAEAEERTAALGKREAEIRQEAKMLESAHTDFAKQGDRARVAERAPQAWEQELGTRAGELDA